MTVIKLNSLKWAGFVICVQSFGGETREKETVCKTLAKKEVLY